MLEGVKARLQREQNGTVREELKILIPLVKGGKQWYLSTHP